MINADVLTRQFEEQEERYLFIVSGLYVAYAIEKLGYKVEYIESDDDIKLMKQIIIDNRFKGTGVADNKYVPCLSKSQNQDLFVFFKENYLDCVEDGWKKLCEDRNRAGWYGESGDTYVDDIQNAVRSIISKDKPKSNRAVIRCLDDIEERDAEWLISGVLPKGQITVLGGDGGVGKTSIWSNIVSAISANKKSIFDEASGNPFIGDESNTGTNKILFFSGEDSVPVILRKKLRLSGADMKKCFFVDIADEGFSDIKFNSPSLETMIAQVRPALCIFDPVQSFLPIEADMAKRNTMRQCMSPLVALGEKYGTTFLIIAHSNKRSHVSGRQRLADSADLWDIARSVLLVGETGEDGIRYVSQEKSSYGMPVETVLYKVGDYGVVQYVGTSNLHDADYVARNTRYSTESKPRDEVSDMILDLLTENGGQMVMKELEETMYASGASATAVRRAKQDLTLDKRIRSSSKGFGADKVWYCCLIEETKQ